MSTLNYKSLMDTYAAVPCHPQLIVCGAESDWGRYVLANRDGEVDFDGFHHAYIQRDDQTFLVPLWEWAQA